MDHFIIPSWTTVARGLTITLPCPFWWKIKGFGKIIIFWQIFFSCLPLNPHAQWNGEIWNNVKISNENTDFPFEIGYSIADFTYKEENQFHCEIDNAIFYFTLKRKTNFIVNSTNIGSITQVWEQFTAVLLHSLYRW